MKYQFRSKPPNGDIVLNRSGDGYDAETPEIAWRMFYQTLYAHVGDTEERLRTRYTIEPLGTLPVGAF